MSQTTLINIRVDEGLKNELENIHQELPSVVSVDPFYSDSNMAHLMRGIKQIEDGKGIVRDLIEADSA